MKTSPPLTTAANGLPPARVQTSIVLDAEPIDKLRKILKLLGGTVSAESLISEWVASIVEGERTDCYIRDSVFQRQQWKDSPRRAEIQAGIIQILDGETPAIQPTSAALESKLPVLLPAADVALLSEICAAAGITGGFEGLAAEVLGNIAQDSLKSDVRRGSHLSHGALELISTGWAMGDDHDAALHRMQDVVDRWNSNAGGVE